MGEKLVLMAVLSLGILRETQLLLTIVLELCTKFARQSKNLEHIHYSKSCLYDKNSLIYFKIYRSKSKAGYKISSMHNFYLH